MRRRPIPREPGQTGQGVGSAFSPALEYSYWPTWCSRPRRISGWSWSAWPCGDCTWASHRVLATMVTDTAPPGLRGTAFGVFNLASGVAMLAASVLAGLLWDRFGATATFAAG